MDERREHPAVATLRRRSGFTTELTEDTELCFCGCGESLPPHQQKNLCGLCVLCGEIQRGQPPPKSCWVTAENFCTVSFLMPRFGCGHWKFLGSMRLQEKEIRMS